MCKSRLCKNRPIFYFIICFDSTLHFLFYLPCTLQLFIWSYLIYLFGLQVSCGSQPPKKEKIETFISILIQKNDKNNLILLFYTNWTLQEMLSVFTWNSIMMASSFYIFLYYIQKTWKTLIQPTITFLCKFFLSHFVTYFITI